MAANLVPFQPHSVIRSTTATTVFAASGHHKSDPHRKNWFTPLFGWSSEPDYINNSVNTDQTNTNNNYNNNNVAGRSSTDFESDLDQKQVVRSRKSPVKFTDEKARKLRMLTVETESFHDAMYHSAIASRFASDFSHRFDL
ncbi:hypothetical protein QVD17_03315 [Tagetes erecta]|uniref:Uncharacterized protein n=1 Tax=Tagetes erecta TaxID=13708 RepID=A0AAD8P9T9_TARER|nr:hypothetical protein QVD17_03315 [Tagetes erecta]